MTPLPAFPLLAIDLSTTRAGWCRMATPDAWQAGSWDCGTGDLTLRLARLGAHLTLALTTSAPPASIVVELIDHRRAAIRNQPETLRALFSAFGVVVECGRRAGVPVGWRTPHLVRERLVGSSTASKADVQLVLRRRGYALPLLGGQVDHDACDALALALVLADEAAFAQRIQEAAR